MDVNNVALASPEGWLTNQIFLFISSRLSLHTSCHSGPSRRSRQPCDYTTAVVSSVFQIYDTLLVVIPTLTTGIFAFSMFSHKDHVTPYLDQTETSFPRIPQHIQFNYTLFTRQLPKQVFEDIGISKDISEAIVSLKIKLLFSVKYKYCKHSYL